ncbi:AcaB family transcriptional regulator [Klebsiella spallanzanii]|uniref:AcaB family transcriptional regulator n=1 Tax=Klebsiella spallanzanii TaxID=2587528 RepID=UPI0011597B50|nr:AcaB family transcriptional regulator [Klebsiella spallanzanii]VUS22584.1 hypothetical protein SB6419_00198 [Klebsiella spallanzanii]
MKLYRATYSLLTRDGRVTVDEQWVFFEAETYSDALEKIPGLLMAMWDCCESQLEVWNLMPDNDIARQAIEQFGELDRAILLGTRRSRFSPPVSAESIKALKASFKRQSRKEKAAKQEVQDDQQ